jgi:1-acyl-sn-glycerol-3-phosphate acyltransferase
MPRVSPDLPPFSRTRFAWFMRYVTWYMRRHFHAVRLLSGEGTEPAFPDIGTAPVIFAANHPGWWDPLVFLWLARQLYPDRLSYGPIDAHALGKYRFFETIGFIGIEPGTWRGSATFLRAAKAASTRADVILWITAQGAFTDPRQRPLELRPGLGHAVAAGAGLVVPVAVEYPFWNERLPEALVAFGKPLRINAASGRDPAEWTAVLAAELTAVQDRLAAAAIARDPAAFIPLLAGRVGVGVAYDVIRRLGAWCRGETFDASHGGEGAARP